MIIIHREPWFQAVSFDLFLNYISRGIKENPFQREREQKNQVERTLQGLGFLSHSCESPISVKPSSQRAVRANLAGR